jgi:hypothetical protein
LRFGVVVNHVGFGHFRVHFSPGEVGNCRYIAGTRVATEFHWKSVKSAIGSGDSRSIS